VFTYHHFCCQQEHGGDAEDVLDRILDQDENFDFIFLLGDISYADGDQVRLFTAA
jgi:uncharacterized tellurite resistance protein B-like protein